MSKVSTKNSENNKKRKSRDAARSRRGQQNDEFVELANHLPLPLAISGQLDRLCVMRLANSYIKIKQLVNFLAQQDPKRFSATVGITDPLLDHAALEALDGFVFVVGPDGQCLYVSDNINHYMGLSEIEVTGNSIYKYIHPCDHEELANQLGGQIPLEDMEIFDGLFCSDSVFVMSNHLKAGSTKRVYENPYRSFFVRMKSTLTSRGKSVNLRASTYRVVHCTGCMKMCTTITPEGTISGEPVFFVAIGVPLMFSSTFEVPLDRCTFTSRHSLDMKFLYCDDRVQELLGYTPAEIIGKSWYEFQHACDLDTVLSCHKTLLTKGQSVSKYYRFLVRNGGWVWLQTKANIVYDSKTCQPEFILCINQLIGGWQGDGTIVASEQITPVPLPVAIETIDKVEETNKKKKKTNTIVLEERTRLLKASAHEPRGSDHIKVESEQPADCCKNSGNSIGKQTFGKKASQCYEGVDCVHKMMNFQDSPPVAWDMNEDALQQQQKYEDSICEHYGFTDTPLASPALVEPTENTETIEEGDSPTLDDCEVNKEKPMTLSDDDDVDLAERAPFIPLNDAELIINDEILAEIEYMDSPICPPTWLDEDSQQGSFGDKHRQRPVSFLSGKKSAAFSAAARKLFPPTGKKSNFIELLTGRASFFPVVSDSEMEVSAPVQSTNLLQGEELLKALDQGVGQTF